MSRLTYEECRELKDAGFRDDIHLYPETNEVGNEPTLSELILACPTDIDGEWFTLTFSKHTKKWLCGYEYHEKFTPECWGTTPEQAVKSLWLALNKK